MKFDFVGKNGFDISEAIKEYAQKRLKKVVNFFGSDVIKEIRVAFNVHRNITKTEVTIFAVGNILRAETSSEDLYTGIDVISDKLVEQIRRHKDRLKNSFEREGVRNAYSLEFDLESLEKEVLASQLVKNKKIELKPMTPEEAIMAMDLVGHSFYVFLDIKTQKTNVVYRREDGNYAIIETYTH